METKEKLDIVEVFNNYHRWKEEMTVILKEMKNYLNYYYQHLIPSLDRDIAGILNYMYVKYIYQLVNIIY